MSQITCLIQACVRILTERMANEAFIGEFRAVEVTTGQTITADIEFANRTNRNLLQVFIENINLHIVNGTPNRWWNIGMSNGVDTARGRYNGCFSWPIVVDEGKRQRRRWIVVQRVGSCEQKAQRGC